METIIVQCWYCMEHIYTASGQEAKYLQLMLDMQILNKRLKTVNNCRKAKLTT